MKLQIKRSNVLEGGEAKAPILEQMEYGELAVNYNSTDPVIFIKDSDDNIIRLTNIRPIGDGAINLDAGTGLIASGDNATANQLTDTTRTLEIDSTWVADFVNANGNGAININAGPGLEASGDNATANQPGDTTRVLSAKVDTNAALEITGSGIGAVAKPSGGIAISSDGIEVVADPAGGLEVNSSGIAAVASPGGGLVVDGNGIGVEFPPFPEPSYGDGLKIENNTVDLVLAPSNNGLNLDSAGISVRIDPGWGIDVTSTGIRFGNDWTNIPELT